jgi:hypothetical protein
MVDDHQNANQPNRVKNTTDGQRQAIYEALLEGKPDMKHCLKEATNGN